MVSEFVRIYLNGPLEKCHSSLTALNSSFGVPRTLSPFNTWLKWIIENFRFPVKMKLFLQTFFCWWVLASVAPAVDSAKLDLSSLMKKRLSTWLQSRTKRELSGMPAAGDAHSVEFVQPEDVKDTLKPHSSMKTNIRTKRNKNSVNQSRRTGCSFLPTCGMHELVHRVHQLNNNLKVGSAPVDKISPLGYGRRRRSLPDSMATLLGNLQVKSMQRARKLQWKSLHEIRRT
ncbi:hypothetical protein GJAV_G00247570 [Gymnothorax javanicus]|nr:hypothetical protein GJAV_G00247570 [Gymnothorax javanicus]